VGIWVERLKERGLWARLCFSFILNFRFPFLFILSFEFKCKCATNSNLNTSSIHIKKIIKFGVQHDATFHTSLEFCLLEYNNISK
jgi:hypothetical protein